MLSVCIRVSVDLWMLQMRGAHVRERRASIGRLWSLPSYSYHSRDTQPGNLTEEDPDMSVEIQRAQRLLKRGGFRQLGIAVCKRGDAFECRHWLGRKLRLCGETQTLGGELFHLGNFGFVAASICDAYTAVLD
jgi:hypothetical protein